MASGRQTAFFSWLVAQFSVDAALLFLIVLGDKHPVDAGASNMGYCRRNGITALLEAAECSEGAVPRTLLRLRKLGLPLVECDMYHFTYHVT